MNLSLLCNFLSMIRSSEITFSLVPSSNIRPAKVFLKSNSVFRASQDKHCKLQGSRCFVHVRRRYPLSSSEYFRLPPARSLVESEHGEGVEYGKDVTSVYLSLRHLVSFASASLP